MCDKSFANGPNLSRHKRQVHKVESTYFYFSVKINIIEKSGEIKIRMRTLNIVNTDTFILFQGKREVVQCEQCPLQLYKTSVGMLKNIFRPILWHYLDRFKEELGHDARDVLLNEEININILITTFSGQFSKQSLNKFIRISLIGSKIQSVGMI